MAVTRLGFGGSSTAYGTFDPKAPADEPQAAYLTDFFVATSDDLYFEAV